MAKDEIDTASSTLVEGMQFVGETGSGHAVVLDGAAGMGRDTGARPMEFLLVGLAGCTAMDVAFILRKQRVEVRSLKVAARARRAPEHPKIYEHIELDFTVAGLDIQRQHIEKAVSLSATRFCSASVMLGKSAEIVHRIHLTNDEGTREWTLEV